jgi:hypothetical protein
MTLGNMRELGVQQLITYRLNDACRHTALIDVSSYPAEPPGSAAPVRFEELDSFRGGGALASRD